MAQYSIINEQLSNHLQRVVLRLRRTLERSAALRTALMIALNAGGCLMLLSPLLIAAGFMSAAVLIANNIQGPLDWFLLGVCAVLSCVTGWICYQLSTLHPVDADGVTLNAAQEPRLFPILQRRLKRFRLQPLIGVKLGTDTGLTVVATPRWPVPLLHSYTLSVGAPLLFFISEPQFRLALAGAVAASAQTRRSLSGWAAQAVRDWPVIVQSLEQKPVLVSRLLLPVARWIAAANQTLGYTVETGVLQAQTRWILDHTDEQTARELLSCQVLASSFVNWHYWPMMFRGADHCPQPIARPFSHFDLLLKGSFTEDAARRWLLKAQAGSGNTQRILQDLLAELKLDFLQCPALPERSAFECIIRTKGVLKALDQHWQQCIAPRWNQRHAEFQAEKNRFEQLNRRSQEQDLRGSSAINFVRLARRFLDKQQNISVFRKMYRANPDDAAVCFTCGEAMLAAGHTLEGCDAMQRAGELDARLANHAQALINQYKHSWLGAESRPGLARSA
ncbi:MAG: hypothetical protein RQ736_03945 [Thiogranum sp.]|nr:hypothetical protein [Thiogranum sp.]